MYAEISSIMDDDDNKPIDMAMVEQMTYLGMCLKESLRMFPALPFAMRKATADIKLSTIVNYWQEKNQRVDCILI